MKIEQFKTTLIQVTREFQTRFDGESKPDVMKRQAILDSEVKELMQAIIENNIVEIADGFVDIIYVLAGSYDKFKHDNEQSSLYLYCIDVNIKQALTYFSLECLHECLIDIHNSNMSKVHTDIFHLIETFQKYRLDTDNFRVKRISDNQWFVYDLNINKLLKPLHYQKANLKPILQKHGYL